MEYLRWVLLLVGGGVLLAVYLIGRYKRVDNLERGGPFDQDTSAADAGNYEFEDPPLPPQNRTPVEISESDARSHVLSNLSHELETLNQLLGRKESEVPVAESRRQQPETPDPVDPTLPDGELLGDLFGEDKEVGPAISELSQPEKVITLHVCARNDVVFSGAELRSLFIERCYEFGEMDIFHSRVNGTTVFSIVNMVEPGWFDMATMDGFTTPGISLFLRLPGPLAGDVAFDVLVSEARELARSLNAQVLDSTRSTLTLQVEQHMREELKHYTFQHKRAAKKTPAL